MSTVRKTKKKHYTVEQANATLPLLRMIVRDITVLAHTLTEQHRRLNRLHRLGYVRTRGHELDGERAAYQLLAWIEDLPISGELVRKSLRPNGSVRLFDHQPFHFLQ